jgi:hypothetical protein
MLMQISKSLTNNSITGDKAMNDEFDINLDAFCLFCDGLWTVKRSALSRDLISPASSSNAFDLAMCVIRQKAIR